MVERYIVIVDAESSILSNRPLRKIVNSECPRSFRPQAHLRASAIVALRSRCVYATLVPLGYRRTPKGEPNVFKKYRCKILRS